MTKKTILGVLILLSMGLSPLIEANSNLSADQTCLFDAEIEKVLFLFANGQATSETTVPELSQSAVMIVKLNKVLQETISGSGFVESSCSSFLGNSRAIRFSDELRQRAKIDGTPITEGHPITIFNEYYSTASENKNNDFPLSEDTWTIILHTQAQDILIVPESDLD